MYLRYSDSTIEYVVSTTSAWPDNATASKQFHYNRAFGSYTLEGIFEWNALQNNANAIVRIQRIRDKEMSSHLSKLLWMFCALRPVV